MSNARLALLTTFLVLAGGSEKLSAQFPPVPISGSVPASCPITTRPQTPFIPPAPYPTKLPEDGFWLGTDKLWTNIREPLIWAWTPHEPGHELEQPTAKFFWFRSDYDWRTEPKPNLKISGRRFDGSAPPILSFVSHAIFGDASRSPSRPPAAMMSLLYVPTPGCWEITADYKGDKLSFVVWLEPANR